MTIDASSSTVVPSKTSTNTKRLRTRKQHGSLVESTTDIAVASSLGSSGAHKSQNKENKRTYTAAKINKAALTEKRASAKLPRPKSRKHQQTPHVEADTKSTAAEPPHKRAITMKRPRST
jgi:hypothetical protein